MSVATDPMNEEDGRAVSHRLAGWLGLAAAPGFAAMALLTAFDGSRADGLCSALHGPFPLGGMVPMYGLMSLVHATPWLALIAGRSRAL